MLKYFYETPYFYCRKFARRGKEISLELPGKMAGIAGKVDQKENLHITLIFIGYAEDQDVMETCNTVREVTGRHKPFLITLNKICYGPPRGKQQGTRDKSSLVKDKNRPRMVWADGEKSKELAQLKEDLENCLAEKVRFEQENRAFAPHITLARINGWKLKDIEPEEIPQVNEDVSFSFEVNSIEVMESTLKRGGGGPKYEVLESIPLANSLTR